MPLVQITLLKGKPPAHVRAIGDGVHRALVAAFEVPPADCFQLVRHCERDELRYDPAYLGIQRSDDVVFISITASTWRSFAQKQALYEQIARNLAREPGLRPEDVLVVLVPNDRSDWSFGNGLASYCADGDSA